MKFLYISFLIVLFIGVLSWYLVVDSVYCIVENTGDNSVNGYYIGLGGLYIQLDSKFNSISDIFGILDSRRHFGVTTISLVDQSWAIKKDKKIIFVSDGDHPEQHIHNPPSTGWSNDTEGDFIPLLTCKGSLQDAPSVTSSDSSNIQTLIQRPVTTSILIAISYVAYYLWANRIDSSAVAFSYQSCVEAKEYWRAITASFSHFDLLHLGFNAMALYQLGELEIVYGTVKYAYLSMALVFITIIICVGLYHVLITKYGRVDMIHQRAVGYSCVLFAWMVAASVRMQQFCPIFLFPSLCFTTWVIPSPVGKGLPVNIGPVLLLVLTKLIMPQSSFTGHLSGIIIGYPLAWNMMDWLTPPIFFAACAVAYIWSKSLWFWNFPGFEVSNNLGDFVPVDQLRKYYLSMALTILVSLGATAAVVYLNHWAQLVPRLVEIFLVTGALQGRRCIWLTDLRATIENAQEFIVTTWVFVGLIFLYDVCTLAAVIGSSNFLLSSGLTWEYYSLAGLALLPTLVLIELGYLICVVVCLQDVPSAATLLVRFRLDAASVKSDLQAIGFCPRPNSAAVFQNQGNRLGYTAVPTTIPTAVATPIHLAGNNLSRDPDNGIAMCEMGEPLASTPMLASEGNSTGTVSLGVSGKVGGASVISSADAHARYKKQASAGVIEL